MKNINKLNSIIEINPSTRVLIQESLLIIIGVIGLLNGWRTLPFSPYLNILGVLLIFISFYIHVHSQKTLKQAHLKSNKIKNIVKEGLYEKIRHPIYLSLLIMDIGIILVIGVLWLIPVLLFFAYLHILTAIKEEEVLIDKFGQEYKDYIKEVPYRMIPKIF